MLRCSLCCSASRPVSAFFSWRGGLWESCNSYGRCAAPRPPVTPTDAGWVAYDAARGPHGLPLLTANTLNAVGRMMPGTAAKNEALAQALTSKGIDKDPIAAAIGDLLSRRAAWQVTGAWFAPVFAGTGLGAFDR